MKIKIHKYKPDWKLRFQKIQSELEQILSFLNPKIEHIGSTSVPGLAAKNIIDIMVGVNSETELEKTIQPMIEHHFIYYQLFNKNWPERRLFVGLENVDLLDKFQAVYTDQDHIPHEEINEFRNCHIHIWQHKGKDWNRHLAFREYLKTFSLIRKEYSELKRKLSLLDWENGMEYNWGKERFIKFHERKALNWFKER